MIGWESALHENQVQPNEQQFSNLKPDAIHSHIEMEGAGSSR